jgi:hypothetical protein
MSRPFDSFDSLDHGAKLPEVLQPARWAKNGAPFASTDTGKSLSALLIKLEAAFKKIDAEALRPPKGNAFASLDELESAEKNAKSAYRSTVVPVVAVAVEIKKQSTIAVKLCLADPKLKAVAKLLAEMAKVADEMADELKDLNAIFRPFDEARKGLVKASDHLKKLIKPHLLALAKGLDQGLRTPTREVWDKQCKTPCYAIHNAIKNTPQLKDEFWATWKVHDGDSFSHALQVAEKSVAKDPRVKAKIEEVITRMCRDLKKEIARLDAFVG